VISEEPGIVEFPAERIVDIEDGGGGVGASDVGGLGGEGGFMT
jgi:hypothetical protein